MKSELTSSFQGTGSAPATARKPPKKKGGAWRKLVPIAIGLALLAAIVVGLRPRPIEVETAVVTTGPLVVTVLEEGKTRIPRRYVVSPPVAGFLQRVELRAGDRVQAGKTVLATIQAEPSSFLNPRARAEAEARMKSAEAAKMQRETQVERARAALDLAQKEVVRAKDLRKSGAISTKDWDNAETQELMLTRDLNTAEFAYQVAEFDRAQAEAALLQSQAPSMDKSKALELTAPVDGYVLNVMEENARIVAAGTPIMEVGDPRELEAEIELLSSDAVGVQIGAEVTIEQWGGDRPLRGKVVLIEPGGYTKVSALGVEEQRVRVRVEFIDPLPPGMMFGDRYRVEARIVTWRDESVLQIPTGALFRRGSDWMTFVVDGGQVRRTKVEIGHNNGVAAEIRSGLAEGQIVVLHPPDAVADGTAVRARAGE